MFQASALCVKMIKMDNLAGLEINQGRPLRNGPDQYDQTGTTGPEHSYNGFRTVDRRNGYGTGPVKEEGEYLRGLLIFSEPFARAALLKKRVVSCFIFESPAVGLLGFRND